MAFGVAVGVLEHLDFDAAMKRDSLCGDVVGPDEDAGVPFGDHVPPFQFEDEILVHPIGSQLAHRFPRTDQLFVLLPFPLAVLGLGLLAALRRAGYATWVAALAFLGGSLLALHRNILLLAMTYELAPAYANATGAVQSALAVLGDTLLMFGFIAGDLLEGILCGGAPLFSAAMLRTKLAPRWVAFLGFAVAITAGWATLLLPFGEVFVIVNFVGAIGFLVWMVAVGIKLWRAPEPDTT